MDKDRIEGAAKQVKGSLQEAIGKITGNAAAEEDGARNKTDGRSQERKGEAKDATREKRQG